LGKPRDNWQTLTEKGIALLRQNQPQQALVQLRRAGRQAPLERTVRYWLGNAHRMVGAFDDAYKIFNKLLGERPGDFDTSFALAFLLRDSGKPQEAATVLVAAADQPGLEVDQLLQVAGFLRDSNQYADAIRICERAVERRPEQADLHFKLGRLYQATGAFDRALKALRKALDMDPSIGPAWTVLAQQQRFAAADDEDFIRIRDAAGRSHGREADMCIAFAYGKALDDLQRWPDAWAQYSKGNREMSGTLPWRRSAWRRFVERAIDSASVNPDRESVPGSGRNAIFIVGMPRSGTTLLEEMLSRHPEIAGRGEMNFLHHFATQRPVSAPFADTQRQELGNTLWKQMRLEGPENGFYIDKNPLNFRYLDTAFELLPTARVLHLTRDGRDSCLSCFFQLFQHEDAAFSYSLESLVAFYSGYRQLMTHWRELRGDRICEVDYNELVHSSDDVLARVLQFMGTDGNDAMTSEASDSDRVIRTASVWQARQPVYSRSVGRWRQYYDLAPEFFDQLAAIDAQSSKTG
jgi:tetratricopeptide (TPR) repeat protein